MGHEVIPGRDQNMTGAELRLIRKACDMTLVDFGAYVGVTDKSIRGWETSDKMLVPVDVADTARALHVDLMTAKQEVLSQYRHAEPGDEVVLTVYRSGAFEGSVKDMAIHNAATGLALHELTDDGIHVWVEWE